MENTKMDYSRVEAWHGEVRAFVEREKPGFSVIAIREDTTTKYIEVREAGRNPNWLITRSEVRFEVEMVSSDGPFGQLRQCKVALERDGRLRLYDESIAAW